MKRRIYILIELALIFIATYLYWFFNPDFLSTIEKYSFFVFTSDYFSMAYSKAQFLTVLLGNFIAQFYKNISLGSVIQASFVVCVIFLSRKILKSLFEKDNNILNIISMIPGLILLVLQNKYPEIFINVQFLVVALLLYSLSFVKSRSIYLATTLLYSILLVLFIPTSYCVAFFIAGVCIMFINEKFANRVKFSLNNTITAIISLILLVSAGYYGYNKYEGLRKYIIMENDAERGEWYKILEKTNSDDIIADQRKLRYVILALNESGILGDKLFSYPMSKSDDFIFPHTLEGQTSFFNSIFYKNLGIPNEAFHYMFQIAESTPFGIDFRSIRYLITYSIERNDPLLYNKYTHILSKSSFNGRYLKFIDKFAMEKFGEDLSVRPEIDYYQKPVFIGVKSFLSDMASLYDSDKNIKALHLSLCGLLADRKLDIFKEILDKVYIDAMVNEELPTHYQEAIIMIYRNNRERLEKYNISNELVEKYDQFTKLINQNFINKEYMFNNFGNTFWLYMYANMQQRR